MLSIQTLKGGSGGQLSSYFEKESAQKDYWAKEAADSTLWRGQGAERLGLSGQPVDQAQFEALMDGKMPDGQQLSHGAGGKRRLGYDLTFSAPKSVSLQALVGKDAAIIAAHDAAVSKAVDFLEQEAAQTRIKRAGEISFEKTDNLTAATFRHETSRELDPQLHTHAVMPNLTLDKNGKARALDASEIFRNKMAAGAVYRSELAAGLQRAGYQIKITDPKQGMFEIEGYSKKQLDKFSKRRAQIEKELSKAAHPESTRAAQSAALRTRAQKQVVTDKAALRKTWRQAADKAGIRLQTPAKSAKASFSPKASKMRSRKIVAETFSDLRRSKTTSTFQQMRGRAMQRSVGQKTTTEDMKAEFDSQWQKRINTGKLAKLDGAQYFDPRTNIKLGMNVTRAVAHKFQPKPMKDLQAAYNKVKFAARVIESLKHLKPKPLKAGHSMKAATKGAGKAATKVAEKAIGTALTGGLKR